MDDHRQFISDVIQGRTALRIDIFDSQENCIGYLSPLTVSVLDNDEIIQKLTYWRNRAKRFFLTQFTATPERTKNWLANTVFKDHSRLLFLIYSRSKLIGQYGFKELSSDSVEIDNLIRGEIGGHPRLIYYAEITLIRWLFETFKVGSIYGFVLSDNAMVLNFHRSVGFRLMELIPLHKWEFDGEIHLRMGEANRPSPDGLYCQKTELRFSDFTLLEE